MRSQVRTLEPLCLALLNRRPLLTPHIAIHRHVSWNAPLLTASSFASVVLESGYRIEGVHLIEPKPRWCRFPASSTVGSPLALEYTVIQKVRRVTDMRMNVGMRWKLERVWTGIDVLDEGKNWVWPRTGKARGYARRLRKSMIPRPRVENYVSPTTIEMHSPASEEDPSKESPWGSHDIRGYQWLSLSSRNNCALW